MIFLGPSFAVFVAVLTIWLNFRGHFLETCSIFWRVSMNLLVLFGVLNHLVGHLINSV